MTGSVALDVVIGLVFIFLLYSLLASIIQEIIATNLSFRAKILEKALARMLQDPEKSDNAFKDKFKTWRRLFVPFNSYKFTRKGELSEAFYSHPLIQCLGEDKWHSKPSYLTQNNFSKAIIDLLRGEGVKVGEDIRPYIEEKLGPTHSNQPYTEQDKGEKKLLFNIGEKTKQQIRSLWVDAQGDVEEFKSLLETWFDDTMSRTTGWYKKYNQVVLLVVGLGIAIIFNVDTIAIAKKLSSDPEIRAQLINQANNFITTHPNLNEEFNLNKATISAMKDIDSVKKILEQQQIVKKYEALIRHRDSLMHQADSLIKNDLKNASDLLALGWSKHCIVQKTNCKKYSLRPNGDGSWGIRLLGWFLTALAISLGAPFWFDLLNKFMKLRGSVQTKSSSTTSVGTEGNDEVKRVG
ncbi:MAG TPA: hypothetical protein VGA80_14420 [Flavobacteriaceae bacterium]